MGCGIIAIAAQPGALGIRLGKAIKDGLKRLEYRGYDSVGFALITHEGRLIVRKSKGMIDKVSEKVGFDYYDGVVGIGHTRWATHGPPSDINAHPHVDCNKRVAVAHNGIIENYLSIKEELIRRGHKFISDTDTEVIPHLIEEFKRLGLRPYEAFKRAISMLKGAYAIVAIDLDEPNKVFFARMTSPLVIGFSKGANFIASDIPAFLTFTRKVLVLRDGEVGYITYNKVFVEKIRDSSNTLSIEDVVIKTDVIDFTSRIRIIDWTPEMAVKAGYPHFMLKEIHEQPQALSQTLAGIHEVIEKVLPVLSKAERVLLVGAGTSYHASLLGALLLNNLAEISSNAIISSEAKWYIKSIREGDVVIAVSQSGETIDTLLAVREAKNRGALVIALSNVIDSAIPRESDLSIYTRAGPEIGVAATKTFTTQVATLTYLSIKLGEVRGTLKRGLIDEMLSDLRKIPEVVSNVITYHEARTRALAKRLSKKQSAYYLGRGFGLPVSMEGALKLKEVAYLHAEAYPAGESKHGPIALVEEDFPVFFTVLGKIDEELLKSNVEEMKARYAWTIGVVPKSSEEIIRLLRDPIKMPVINPYIAPIAYIVPYQLIAYYTAITRGYDPDKPRNLAKTVTVV